MPTDPYPAKAIEAAREITQEQRIAERLKGAARQMENIVNLFPSEGATRRTMKKAIAAMNDAANCLSSDNAQWTAGASAMREAILKHVPPPHEALIRSLPLPEPGEGGAAD